MVTVGQKSHRGNRATAGFSIVELLFIVVIVMILSAITIVQTRSAIASYQLDAAVDSASGAIHGSRFQAIMHGYPYQLDFNAATNTFQLSSEIPPATTFSSIGGPGLISASQVALGVGAASSSSAGHVILQFKPNGSVLIASGQTAPLSFTISYNGTTKTLTVSKYGSIAVR
jgi:Tfp pilus assembly protein FimT